MNIPVIDKSSYLKGLLIIAKKNKILAEAEKKIIRGIANKLGFASDFYEEKIVFEKKIKDYDLQLSNSNFLPDGIDIKNIRLVLPGLPVKLDKEMKA